VADWGVSPGEEQKDPGKCGADDGTTQVRTTDCDNVLQLPPKAIAQWSLCYV